MQHSISFLVFMAPEQDVFTNCVRDLYEWGGYTVTPLREPGFMEVSEPKHTLMGPGISGLVYAAVAVDPLFNPAQDPKLRAYKEVLDSMLLIRLRGLRSQRAEMNEPMPKAQTKSFNTGIYGPSRSVVRRGSIVSSENVQRALIIVADDVPLSVQSFSSLNWTPTNLNGSAVTPADNVTFRTYFTRYSELERLIRKRMK